MGTYRVLIDFEVIENGIGMTFRFDDRIYWNIDLALPYIASGHLERLT